MLITRNRNLILATDSYKLTQWKQYPPGTRHIYSYAEPRSNKLFPYVVNFGLQYYLREYLQGSVVTHEDILEADDVCAWHFNDPKRKIFNRDGWKRMVDEHGGRLPVEIWGLDEGLKVGIRNSLFTMENTDPKCGWLTNPLETLLLKVWYTTTVATLSHFSINKIGKYLLQSTDEKLANAVLKFMLQDFGARGASSEETSWLGGMSHLVNSYGTDTIQAILKLRDYYDVDLAKDMPGFSVAAMEHSTVTTWPNHNEIASYTNAFNAYPDGILSIVCDSYDQRNAISEIFGNVLKMTILDRGARDGVTVIRLDSGDPLVEVPKGIELLMEKFGFDLTYPTGSTTGFKLLPKFIRILQGDGINYESIGTICQGLVDRHISVANVACFGMGGGLLQKVDRDMCGFALKCSNVDINGQEYPVQKLTPSKPSKPGRLVVNYQDDQFITLGNQRKGDNDGNWLKLRFRNGELYNETIFSAVRKNVDSADYYQRAA